jgi:hypothetical protein
MRILLAGLLVIAAPVAATGIEPAARVTSDSLEYCAELAARLAAMPGATQEPAASLATDGLRLCQDGYPRAGVAKLRRAIRAARDGH